MDEEFRFKWPSGGGGQSPWIRAWPRLPTKLSQEVHFHCLELLGVCVFCLPSFRTIGDCTYKVEDQIVFLFIWVIFSPQSMVFSCSITTVPHLVLQLISYLHLVLPCFDNATPQYLKRGLIFLNMHIYWHIVSFSPVTVSPTFLSRPQYLYILRFMRSESCWFSAACTSYHPRKEACIDSRHLLKSPFPDTVFSIYFYFISLCQNIPPLNCGVVGSRVRCLVERPCTGATTFRLCVVGTGTNLTSYMKEITLKFGWLKKKIFFKLCANKGSNVLSSILFVFTHTHTHTCLLYTSRCV